MAATRFWALLAALALWASCPCIQGASLKAAGITGPSRQPAARRLQSAGAHASTAGGDEYITSGGSGAFVSNDPAVAAAVINQAAALNQAAMAQMMGSWPMPTPQQQMGSYPWPAPAAAWPQPASIPSYGRPGDSYTAFPQGQTGGQPLSLRPAPQQTDGYPSPSSAPDSSSLAEELLRLVNDIRGRSGLGPLSLDARLTAAARAHSNDMARMRRTVHDGSDGSKAHERVRHAGYDYSTALENVASRSGQASARAFFDSWVQSPGHYNNIMNAEVVHMGAACSTSDQTYCCQNFAAPAR